MWYDQAWEVVCRSITHGWYQGPDTYYMHQILSSAVLELPDTEEATARSIQKLWPLGRSPKSTTLGMYTICHWRQTQGARGMARPPHSNLQKNPDEQTLAAAARRRRREVDVTASRSISFQPDRETPTIFFIARSLSFSKVIGSEETPD
jgi:hypothetical protein